MRETLQEAQRQADEQVEVGLDAVIREAWPGA